MQPTEMSDLTSALYEVLDATIEVQCADFGDIQLYDESTEVPGLLRDCRCCGSFGLWPRITIWNADHYRGCEYPSGLRVPPRHRRLYGISWRTVDAVDRSTFRQAARHAFDPPASRTGLLRASSG